MSRLLRIALLWLAALAVPVQGFAAVTMLHCGPVHSESGKAESARKGHVHADANRHVPAADRHHGDDGDRAGPGTQAAVDDSGVHHGAGKTVADLHKLSKSKCASCASCASCCSILALPSALPSLDSPLLAESPFPVFPGFLAVFLTDGPERPPRLLLA